MAKMILSPAYEIVKEHKCNHDKTVIRLGNVVYEFCDVCFTLVIRKEAKYDEEG